MPDVPVSPDFVAEYADDPHTMLVVNGERMLLHPEWCPVSLVYEWSDDPSVPNMTTVYECPAGVEAWRGDGLPPLPDGMHLLRIEMSAEGANWILMHPDALGGE